MKAFVETAEAAGRLKNKGPRTPKAVLLNFNLLRDGRPTNAAMLLFGKNPNRFFNNIQVHCFHLHGTEKRKPIASQQPYEGRLPEMIDQAVEFVLGKIDRSVGTRATSTQPPVAFEIPRPVITEAIVNAVTHRNYRHNAFVQVIVFADRILTEMLLSTYDLNERQLKAVNHVKISGRITNAEYQRLTGTTRKTAARDLDDLVRKDIFERIGEKRGSHYILAGKK